MTEKELNDSVSEEINALETALLDAGITRKVMAQYRDKANTAEAQKTDDRPVVKVKQPITDEQYLNTQTQLTLIAGLAQDMDLNGFLARINDSHSIAPILDPTLYRAGMKRLELIADLARAMQKVKTAGWNLLVQIQKEEATAGR